MQGRKEREIMTTAIGNQIKRKREEEGKSQREMAEDLGVAQSALSQLENGKPASLNIEKIEFICDYLGIEHTKKKLKEAKEGSVIETPGPEKPTKPERQKEATKTKSIKEESESESIETILEKLQQKYGESMDLATKYLSEANVYADVIEMIKGVKK
jgi:transcriptional regulator with XRE-family HTH domain